jgi:hypothetical protein
MARICTPHQGAHGHRDRQHLLAVLHLRGADDGREDAAEILQGLTAADDQAGEARRGDHVQIGRQEGGRVEDAEAGHAQHAVQEVAGEVARQVLPDEALVLGLGLFEAGRRRHLRLDGLYAVGCYVHAPCRLQGPAAPEPSWSYR